jgi:hypothetical protein
VHTGRHFQKAFILYIFLYKNFVFSFFFSLLFLIVRRVPRGFLASSLAIQVSPVGSLFFLPFFKKKEEKKGLLKCQTQWSYSFST